jgi:DNA-binding response OmpR family regulator
VVEYDPQVLCVLRDILVRAGFTVLLARSGEKALQVYQQHRMEVDLLVTDGLPLEIEQLTSQRPELKVLRLSGFAGAESASGLPMLNKPFTPAALVEAVRALLGRPQPRPIRPKRANA